MCAGDCNCHLHLNQTSNLFEDRLNSSEYKEYKYNYYKTLEHDLPPVNTSEEVPVLKVNKDGKSYSLHYVSMSVIKRSIFGYVYVWQCNCCKKWFIGCCNGAKNPYELFISNFEQICSNNNKTGCSGTEIHLINRGGHIVHGSMKVLFYVDNGGEEYFKFIVRYLYWSFTISIEGRHPYGLLNESDVDNFCLLITNATALPRPNSHDLSTITYFETKSTTTRQKEDMDRMKIIMDNKNHTFISLQQQPIKVDMTSGFRQIQHQIILEKQKEYRQENAEKIKEYRAVYNEEHDEEIKQREKEYRQENAPQIKEYNAFYKKEHAPQIKEYNKEYNQIHAPQIKEQRKEYNQIHAPQIKEQRKEYNQIHAPQIKEYNKEYKQKNAPQIKEYRKTPEVKARTNAARKRKTAKLKELKQLQVIQELNPSESEELQRLTLWDKEKKRKIKENREKKKPRKNKTENNVVVLDEQGTED